MSNSIKITVKKTLANRESRNFLGLSTTGHNVGEMIITLSGKNEIAEFIETRVFVECYQEAIDKYLDSKTDLNTIEIKAIGVIITKKSRQGVEIDIEILANFKEVAKIIETISCDLSHTETINDVIVECEKAFNLDFDFLKYENIECIESLQTAYLQNDEFSIDGTYGHEIFRTKIDLSEKAKETKEEAIYFICYEMIINKSISFEIKEVDKRYSNAILFEGTREQFEIWKQKEKAFCDYLRGQNE